MSRLKDLYDQTLETLRKATDTKDIDSFIASNPFVGTAPVDDRFMTAHVLAEGSECVLLQYRYYDTSKAFSIQPDMNVYLIKLLKDGQVVAREEIKFLDSSVYG